MALFAYRAVDEEGRISSGSLDATNAIGLTPLHSAAISGHVDMTKYLLSRGATCSTPTGSIQQIQTKTINMVVAALQEILQHCPIPQSS